MAIAVPCLQARRPRDKAGEVKDDVYSDKEYNFKLTLNDKWKYKIKDNDDKFRLVLVQKNYEIPPDYLDAPDYTMVPRLVLWIDTTSMSAFAFMDSLLSETYSSEQKKELLREFDILNDNISEGGNSREKLVTRKKRALELGDNKALEWTGQMKYRKEVAESDSSIGGKRVIGAYGGSMVGIKEGDNIYVFHLICEWNYFESNMAKAMEIIESITWK
jgi:hypothetical protein